MLRKIEGLVLLVNILSSVVFAVYAYTVLWGTIEVWIMQFPFRNPAQLSFALCYEKIALPGMLYAVSQAIGPLFRSPGNVWLYLGAILTSMASAAVVGVGLLWWVSGSYVPTRFQEAALVLWGLAVLIDLIVIGVGARFLQRSWLGEGGISAHGQ